MSTMRSTMFWCAIDDEPSYSHEVFLYRFKTKVSGPATESENGDRKRTESGICTQNPIMVTLIPCRMCFKVAELRLPTYLQGVPAAGLGLPSYLQRVPEWPGLGSPHTYKGFPSDWRPGLPTYDVSLEMNKLAPSHMSPKIPQTLNFGVDNGL